MVNKATALVAALCLAVPAFAGDDAKDKDKKAKRPGLELRSTPRFSFSPAQIMFTAELKGGDDGEELYCPEVEWEWGDGSRSVEEGDCDPWTPGTTKLERRYTAHHLYQYAGLYQVRVTLRKSGKNLAIQTLSVTIRAGLGDTSPEPGD